MSPRDPKSTEQYSTPAGQAFRAALAEALDSERYLPTVLARAYAAGIRRLTADNDSLDLANMREELPGATDWLDCEDPPDEVEFEESLDDLDFSECVDVVLSMLGAAAATVEELASTDDSDYAGFTSSGGTTFYALRVNDRWYSFNTHGDVEPLVTTFEGEGAAGRVTLLRRLIQDWLGPACGSIDVVLEDAFDRHLRDELRAEAERNGNGPWYTGLLGDDLSGVDDEDLPRLSSDIARLVGASNAEVLASLRRLHADPGEPSSDLDRRVAWAVSWPDLDLRTT